MLLAVLFPQVQSREVTGPAEVLTGANTLEASRGGPRPPSARQV